MSPTALPPGPAKGVVRASSVDADRLVRCAVRLAAGEAGCLVRLEGDGLVVDASAGIDGVRPGFRQPAPVGLQAYLSRSIKPLLVSDAADVPEESLILPFVGENRFQAGLFVPFSSFDGAAVGGLLVLSGTSRAWSAEEVSALEDLAALARLTVSGGVEAKLRRALDQIARQQFALDQHAIVATTDLQGVITYANDRFCELSGYSREELIGSNHRLVKSGFHSTEFFREMYQTISQRKVWHGDICNRARDGRLYWVATTIVPFIDQDGNLEQYVAIRSDITALKQMAEELRLSREWLSSVFEALADGLVVRDVAGRLISANAAARRILGERWFQPGSDFDPELLRRMVRQDGGQVGPDESPYTRTLKTSEALRDVVMGFRREDGSIVWLSVNTQPVREPSGKVQAVVTSFMDITLRVEAEKALRDSEARLRAFVEHAPAAVAMFDRDMRYLVASRQWYTDYNISQTDVTGLSHYEVFPEIPENWKEDHRRALQGHVLQKAADPFVRADGSTQWLSYELRPWHRSDGGIGGIVMFTRDITVQKHEEEERAHFEQKLMEAQKLESLGVLAGGIAHDFNNILTGIVGNNSLAMAELPEESPVIAHLEGVREAGARAADLIRQMLAYSGRMKFDVRKLDMSRLVEETTRLLNISVSKKVHMQFDLASNLPPVVADAAQISQVIMNLVINASEAIGDRDGNVRVTTSVKRVDRGFLNSTQLSENLQPGEYVCLEVADTGCGIDPENLKRIFDPFFTTKFTGRGLGLAAVLGIVRGHKGTLKVESQLGRGTNFTMLLPSSTGQCDTPPHVPTADDAWRGSGTVLVIEDEETVRHTVERILNVIGFTVIMAADGRAGLSLFAENPERFDLVLLDLTMPCLDGAQVFVEIRQMNKKVPILLMSGYGEQEATEKFAGGKLNGFVQKPFDIRTLQRTVKAALTAGKTPGPAA